MRALIQRVSNAKVLIKETGSVRSIGTGLVILLGVGKNDTKESAAKLAQKTAQLRVFSNEAGKFDLSLLDIKGEALVVSQFTLYGDASKGRRPDFTASAPPQEAKALYEEYVRQLKASGVAKVEEGEFQAHMEVSLVNNGPVTVMVEV